MMSSYVMPPTAGRRSDAQISETEAEAPESVQMAEREGRKKSAVACATHQGLAAHLPVRRVVSCAQPPVCIADAASSDRSPIGVLIQFAQITWRAHLLP